MNDTLPVSVELVELLVQQAKLDKRPFTKELAALHLRLDEHKGELKSQAFYAKRWHWSKSKVNRCWDDLMGSVQAKAKQPKAKKKEDKEPRYELDSWQHQYAEAFVKGLIAEGITVRSYKTNPARTLQSYAHTFDQLKRLDGHSRNTIEEVVRYLFHEDDFWVRTGNITSALKLRKKLKSDDQFLFDKLLHQMTERRNGKPGKRSTTALQQSTAETLAILRARRPSQ